MDQNMKSPKISVLMPVYNAGKYLREAIDSILNQTFKDFEFIVVNDASTDSSKEIIMSYHDQRIRYFENTHNLGVSRSLNKGLKHAKATYIARMDADDISYTQRLGVQYNTILKDDTVALVASSYEMIDEHGKYLYTVDNVSSSEEIFYNLQFHNCLGHPTVIFNKQIILKEFHGYKNCQAEDYELWLRISKKYKILKVNRVLHQLRILDSSRVYRSNLEITNNAIMLAQNNLQSLIAKPINLNIIKVLADLNLLNYPPQYSKVVLTVLNQVNTKILAQCPSFLDRLIVTRCSTNKYSTTKLHLLIASLINSKFSSLFKYIYKLFRLVKYS